MGLGASEIAPLLHTPLRTVQRDVEELKIWVTQEAEVEQVRSFKQSLLTWTQAGKEMWALYGRPTRPGETSGVEVSRKLGAMAHIIAINREMDNLLFRPPTREIMEMRREYERMKSEYELAKRNGVIR